MERQLALQGKEFYETLTPEQKDKFVSFISRLGTYVCDSDNALGKEIRKTYVKIDKAILIESQGDEWELNFQILANRISGDCSWLPSI